MTKLTYRIFLAVAAMIAATTFASAHEIKVGDLLLTDLWSRATPAGAEVAVAYLAIENKGTAPDRLVKAASPVGKAELHEMSDANGVMTMRPLDGGLAIAPGQKVTLAPNGTHVMITGLKTPLKEGEMLHVTLTFEKAGNVDATFHIRSVGAQGPGGAGSTEKTAPHDMDMNDMDHSKMKM